MTWAERSRRLGRTGQEIRDLRQTGRQIDEDAFVEGQSELLLNVLPDEIISLDLVAFLALLRRRYGKAVDIAIDAVWSDPSTTDTAPDEIRGPTVDCRDSSWLTRTNMVGVNVRTVGSFINVAKYALTLSRAHDSIHLLPVWEPGVVGSLYGMSSWKINGEFFDTELAEIIPHLDTPARQLKATINLLHMMGKSVGMDVIPHTDRYSEIVLANPHHFEWLRREDTRIVDHRSDLHEEVQRRILDYLDIHGAADGSYLPDDGERERFFDQLDDTRRNERLFGQTTDPEGRTQRRSEIARHVYRRGYEPVPATMAPPYRGITVDPETVHVDADGHVWREYIIEKPQSMSRVFGPLTRYKLYERLDDNRDWQIDFDRPRRRAWEYVQQRYADVQQMYGFDFMRGDMSHVQMRPEGVPSRIGSHYDLLGSVKSAVITRNRTPYFGYFAETFIAPPDVMSYGDEIDHLEASTADVTLGDLQSCRVDDPEFLRRLRQYRDIGLTRAVQPCFTVMTADKDDPRFDEFYRRGNEARYFSALFLADMPSYTGLNYECRDVHFTPAANENYTKLYVFQERSGPKATSGPFIFGHNGFLFYLISRIRLFAEEVLPLVRDSELIWLLPPDPTAGRFVAAWTFRDSPFVFIVNFGKDAVGNVHIPTLLRSSSDRRDKDPRPTLLFSTDDTREEGEYGEYAPEIGTVLLPSIGAGEGLAISLR